MTIHTIAHSLPQQEDRLELLVGDEDEKCRRKDEIVDSGVDTTTYKGLYLLQKRRRLKHNENIVVTYGIRMVC